MVLLHLLLIRGTSNWYAHLAATPARLFFSGTQAVTLFFVLSGFVLSVQQSSSRRVTYLQYLLKRFCRIYLPFLAALLLAYAGARVFYLRTPTDNSWINATWSHAPSLRQLGQAALTNMRYAEQFNTAFWSVFLEIQVSLIFPLLFALVKRVPLWVALLLLAGLLTLNAFFYGQADSITVQTLCSFVIGILAFLYLPRLRQWVAGQRRAAGLLLFALAVVGYYYGNGPILLTPVAATARAVQNTIPAVAQTAASPSVLHLILAQCRVLVSNAACVALMVCAIELAWLRQFLRHPVLLRSGALSYSTYLIHGTILFAMLRCFWGRIPVSTFVLLFLVLVYAGSELFHLAVDAPSVELGRRVGRRSKVA